jgi:hypothetical protein
MEFLEITNYMDLANYLSNTCGSKIFDLNANRYKNDRFGETEEVVHVKLTLTPYYN